MVMSALPPKEDICGATRDVRFGPADMPRGGEFNQLAVQQPDRGI